MKDSNNLLAIFADRQQDYNYINLVFRINIVSNI